MSQRPRVLGAATRVSADERTATAEQVEWPWSQRVGDPSAETMGEGGCWRNQEVQDNCQSNRGV